MPTAFQAGRRGFASRGLATRMILWRQKRAGGASFALIAASDGSRLFSTFPVQARGCHLLRESPLLVWVAVHEEDRSLGMEGRSMCGFGRWKTSPLLPGVQAERLRTPTIEPTCRLFPSPIQVLLVVVPPCSATLVLCRWDQQRTTDSVCHVSTPAETAQGRCKGRRQNSAQPMCQRELLEEERVSAFKVVARELATS
jgi:hypothetical protein